MSNHFEARATIAAILNQPTAADFAPVRDLVQDLTEHPDKFPQYTIEQVDRLVGLLGALLAPYEAE